MLSKKAERRLNKLVRYMEELPREARKHFSMGHWFWDREYRVPPHTKITRRDLEPCGTSACALGWATVIPEFHRAGLQMTGEHWVPRFRRRRGHHAAMAFFNLTEEQSRALFSPGNRDRTPKAWAKRAKKLIARWKKEAA